MNLLRHAWLAPVMLAACASPAQWEKPGVTATTMEQDSQQCRVQASIAAPMPERYVPPPSGSATVTTGILSRQEQLAAYEAEQFQKCMTGKGYSSKR